MATKKSGSFEAAPGVFMTATCHHRKDGACGACYARVVTTLEKIASSFDAPPAIKAIVAGTVASMQAESPRASSRGRG